MASPSPTDAKEMSTCQEAVDTAPFPHKHEDDVDAPPEADRGSIKIRAVGPEADPIVCAHWTSMWHAVGMDASDFVPDRDNRTLDFIGRARERLAYQTFVAETEHGETVGSASCQVWEGPQPTDACDVSSKIGTMWAVCVKPEHRRQGVATRLVERCIDHWREAGCSRAVLLFASEDGRRVYERLGFKPGPMLALDISSHQSSIREDCKDICQSETLQYKVAAAEMGNDLDLILADHYRRCMLMSGRVSKHINPDAIKNTIRFIEDARKRLGFQAFVAYGESDEIVGSVCSQVWEGPFPLVLNEAALKFGSVWGLYVRPDIPCGDFVGAAMVKKCVRYLESIGCHKVLTLCPNKQSEALFREQADFRTGNAMVLDLIAEQEVSENVEWCHLAKGATRHMIDRLRCYGEVSHMTNRQLAWLATANHNQLSALREVASEALRAEVVRLQKEAGLFVDPKDNWFTQNVERLGRGFDLKEMSSKPHRLAAKFDRLAPKYEEWTVGNRSEVESWVVRMAAPRLEHLPDTARLFDICCGTGLMGHLLRICGYRGLLSGFDISRGMLDVASDRKCYDYLSAANTNERFALPNCSADVILCSGAMELLETETVIKEFARLLRRGGELWVTFQADAGDGAPGASPTAHQNVRGITKEDMKRMLEGAHFEIDRIDFSPEAFWTPSPSPDRTLHPVPYYFVCCKRI